MVEMLVDEYTQNEVHDLMNHQINNENKKYVIVTRDGILWVRSHFLVDEFVNILSLGSALNAFSQSGRNPFAHTIIKPNAVVVKM